MIFNSKFLARLALAGFLPLAACSSDVTNSELDVSSVDHSEVKRQSIGNCWIYAHATWMESLHLSHTGQEINVSESYWTWWHWYRQLTAPGQLTEIETGGFWSESTAIILNHGWVLEKDFIVEEAGAEMSKAQKKALDAINLQLKAGGRLATPAQRTAANVRAELDKAYGVTMANAEAIAKSAVATVVGKRANGTSISLRDALAGQADTRWTQVSFPRLIGQNAQPSASQIAARKAVFKRVMRALNDRKPVVMTMMIDFNALDNTDGTFRYSTLQAAGGMGNQGGHMVVLHDYTVENVPGVGTIGEGDVSAELKAKALEGDLTLLVSKNSWGKNRPDRGLSDGYTRFDRDYLTKQLQWKSGNSSSFYTTLTNFVLPPGY